MHRPLIRRVVVCVLSQVNRKSQIIAFHALRRVSLRSTHPVFEIVEDPIRSQLTSIFGLAQLSNPAADVFIALRLQ